MGDVAVVDHLHFVVLKSTPDTGRLATVYARLGEILSERLGTLIEMRRVARYDELFDELARGRWPAVMWLPPAIYVDAERDYGVWLLGRMVRHRSDTYHGALFVREGGLRRSAHDLREARVGWVDRRSCSGYLFPRRKLGEQGIDSRVHFESEQFFGSHEAVVRAVDSGEIDAGACWVHVRHEAHGSAIVDAAWTSVVEAAPMRPLAVTDPIPNDTICATPELEWSMCERITRSLGEMHRTQEGRRLLRDTFEATRFEPAQAGEYESVRHAVNATKAR